MENWKDPSTPFAWLAVGVLVISTLLVFIVVFVRQYVNGLRQKEQEKHELKMSYQRELLESSIEIQEKERARIASNLHDDLIAQLYGMKLQNSDAVLNKMLQQGIQTARSISHDLCPPMIENLDMPELISDFSQTYEQECSIQIQSKSENGFSLDTSKKLQLYRIFQEVLTNILKHAKATEVEVFYRLSEKYLSLVIRDNGIGFKTNHKNGLGLKNIELRAQVLHAQYRFKENHPTGTSFILRADTQ